MTISLKAKIAHCDDRGLTLPGKEVRETSRSIPAPAQKEWLVEKLVRTPRRNAEQFHVCSFRSNKLFTWMFIFHSTVSLGRHPSKVVYHIESHDADNNNLHQGGSQTSSIFGFLGLRRERERDTAVRKRFLGTLNRQASFINQMSQCNYDFKNRHCRSFCLC